MPVHEFDKLAISMQLESSQVVGGGELMATVTLENATDYPIVDRHCSSSSRSWGIARADESAEILSVLGKIFIDCGGVSLIPPNWAHRQELSFEAIQLRNIDREPFPVGGGRQALEPGEYLAYVQYGDHPRIDVPFSVIG